MKNLASDVGGLKNALTNVKVRGNFGELQLKALLEQMLSPEQYDENVATVRGSSERVEFATKLPGKDDPHGSVYLPVDSKFPKDVYDQYVDAIDAGDAAVIKSKSSQFENTILAMARDISTKYISVPDTTNFASTNSASPDKRNWSMMKIILPKLLIISFLICNFAAVFLTNGLLK